MKVSIDISYYPLNEEYVAPIHDFIARLNKYNHLGVETNGMSTQVFGEYDEVMQALTTEIKKSFELPHSVFILKVINAHLQKS
jgi:uncharacterized protein YqgV (UPF0045/DUF77 family)